MNNRKLFQGTEVQTLERYPEKYKKNSRKFKKK